MSRMMMTYFARPLRHKIESTILINSLPLPVVLLDTLLVSASKQLIKGKLAELDMNGTTFFLDRCLSLIKFVPELTIESPVRPMYCVHCTCTCNTSNVE